MKNLFALLCPPLGLRILLALAAAVSALAMAATPVPDDPDADGWRARSLDQQLSITLRKLGFTGAVEQSLERRLGRGVDPRMAELGRTLFFDRVSSLHNDNSCAGCHAPSHGFGDSQSIAIGIQSNLLVGPGRTGPRNQRRTPSVANTAFYPTLMWNGRFSAPSGDPFDNAQGYRFPAPEADIRFGPGDPLVRHLLIAQAHMPPTELNEAAGFTGARIGLDPRFFQFDDGFGARIPDPDDGGFRNDPIRAAVVQRLNASPSYVARFGDVFPQVRAGVPIDMTMFARAIAEFEFTLVRANAPLDQFARGDYRAMSAQEKQGALTFFGKGNCVACHAVSGKSNEMFSDFEMHNIGVPQIAPVFGFGKGNTIFDGPAEDEDFGLEQFTGQRQDRYKFRSSPLRNVGLQPAFFHNGAFTRLEDAVRHHLDVLNSLQTYNARDAGVAADLALRMAPASKIAATIDPKVLAATGRLSEGEFQDLVHFLRYGLLDARAGPLHECKLVPPVLPEGIQPLTFEKCR